MFNLYSYSQDSILLHTNDFMCEVSVKRFDTVLFVPMVHLVMPLNPFDIKWIAFQCSILKSIISRWVISDRQLRAHSNQSSEIDSKRKKHDMNWHLNKSEWIWLNVNLECDVLHWQLAFKLIITRVETVLNYDSFSCHYFIRFRYVWSKKWKNQKFEFNLSKRHSKVTPRIPKWPVIDRFSGTYIRFCQANFCQARIK